MATVYPTLFPITQTVFKRCSRCKSRKRDVEFASDARAIDGKQSQCYQCQRDGDNKRYAANRAVKAQRQREYMAQLPPEVRRARARKNYLAYKHGITIDQYEDLLASQRGLCAICNKPPKTSGKHIRLQVDHDHKTGRVRGLLCNTCNNAVGRLGDNVEGLIRCVNYLLGTSIPTPTP